MGDHETTAMLEELRQARERLAGVEERLERALTALQLVEESLGRAWVTQAPSLAVAVQAKCRWLESLVGPGRVVADVVARGDELIAADSVDDIVAEGLALAEQPAPHGLPDVDDGLFDSEEG